MAGLIPQEVIDDILHRTDIVAVIGERLPLRRAGVNFKVRCPFHEERTPSFTVSPDRQTYRCFGCGAYGTAIGFLMAYDRLGFRDAVAELAARAGVSLPEHAPGRTPAHDHAPLYEVLEQADRFFRQALRTHPARQAAIDYLQRRGISGEIAATFGIGFAPPGWNQLLKQFDDPRPAIRAGLIVERDDRRYDRFRDRITFPIHDRRGRVIGFGARTIGDAEPKYLNSPETPVFQKGREIYGLYHALQQEQRPQRLIVVEGYMDVIALAQAGIRGAVATLGTATSREQALILLRSAAATVLCFDGDQAGRTAALRATEDLLPIVQGDHEVRVLLLPDNSDPDDLVRSEGRAAFEQRLTEAAPMGEHFLTQLSENCDLATVDGRNRLLQRAARTLKRMPASLLRETLIGRLSDLTHTDPQRIDQLLQQRDRGPAIGAQHPGAPSGTNHRGHTGHATVASPSPTHSTAPPHGSLPAGSNAAAGAAAPHSDSVIRRTPIYHAIALLLQEPKLAQQAGEPDRFADRDIDGLELLQQLLEIARRDPQITTARLLERFRATKHEEPLKQLATWQHAEFGNDQAAELLDALTRVEERILDGEQARLIGMLEAPDTNETGQAALGERLRAAQRLQLLLDRRRQHSGLSDEEQREVAELRKRFRLQP
ncbi:DNA primase [Halorhodospira abdelmalekii]|uniref:DNA primase n=1 Tax=Halorhodospira abdelmalekii TaxID=421629 RepID=UPI0019059317|nr:DNA primase [Halorhodospira abdelmalekii]MBK1735355.1 DNA primase [Halorhodospira abdelmalekii]